MTTPPALPAATPRPAGAPLALEGIRVADFSHFIAGPLCARTLADLGAEVIKIEDVAEGDPVRRQGAMRNGYSLYFATFNRNKRSMTLDLRSSEGMAALRKLIATADLVVTFVKTGEGNRPDAFSLVLIENGMEGFEHGKKLNKMGFHGHDTAELSFSDVFVPDENLIGGAEGKGFVQLMMNLPLERLSIGVAGAAAAQAALDWTVAYTKDREAFGQRIIEFQNTRFTLADLVTTVDALWAYVDRAITLYGENKLSAEDAAQVKFWATEREWEVLDACVQLHGGYGYIMEYPIARAFLDARVHRIYGGTNEIMRDIVSRQIVGKR